MAPGPGALILYMLTTDGDVYKYDANDYASKNYNATKVSEYSNITKMISYSTRRTNAGGCDYLILMEESGKYYNIDSMCV